jgi:hypothetical protein
VGIHVHAALALNGRDRARVERVCRYLGRPPIANERLHELDTCPKCGGPMRWLEVATTPDAIARALSDHGIAPRAPPPPSATAPEQLTLPFGA